MKIGKTLAKRLYKYGNGKVTNKHGTVWYYDVDRKPPMASRLKHRPYEAQVREMMELSGDGDCELIAAPRSAWIHTISDYIKQQEEEKLRFDVGGFWTYVQSMGMLLEKTDLSARELLEMRPDGDHYIQNIWIEILHRKLSGMKNEIGII